MQDPRHNYHVHPEPLTGEFHAYTITRELVTVRLNLS